MNCKTLKLHFVDFLDGSVKPSLKEGLEQHISSCPKCRQSVASAADVSTVFRRLPRHSAPPQVFQQIQKRISNPRTAPPYKLQLRRLLVPVAGAAALILALVSLEISSPNAPVREVVFIDIDRDLNSHQKELLNSMDPFATISAADLLGFTEENERDTPTDKGK